MPTSLGMRLWFDLVYFIVIPVIWLNITFGIVIDTFSALRSAKNERMENTTELCFICGISRQVFDRSSDQPDGFKTHLRMDHNMWAYLNFIFFIWEQDKDDDDGLEYYVRHKIDANEITWFPLNKAMKLELGDTDQEVLAKKLHSSLEKTQTVMGGRLSELRSDIGIMLENLTEALKEANVQKEEGNRAELGEDEQEWYPALGYNVYVLLNEINGLDVSEDELKQFSVRVISDTGIASYESASADPARKACLFPAEDILVAENAQPNDRNTTFSLQILQGGTKFAGMVEIPISEPLTIELGTMVEKSFSRMGQIEECILQITYSFEQAKTFTKGYGDEDSARG